MTRRKAQNQICVRALRTKQGRNDEVFSFFIKGSDITRVAEISRITRDEDNALKGFQRKEIQNHVKGIVEYLDRGNVLFPNAIILALSPEVGFKQSRGPTPEGIVEVAQIGTLAIPIREAGRRVAWIVDGSTGAGKPVLPACPRLVSLRPCRLRHARQRRTLPRAS